MERRLAWIDGRMSGCEGESGNGENLGGLIYGERK